MKTAGKSLCGVGKIIDIRDLSVILFEWLPVSYDITVDDENKVIHILWNGAVDLTVLKRYILSYRYHISHANYHMLYDFLRVGDVNLDSCDLKHLAKLINQILDPLLKNIKIAIVIADPEMTKLAEMFVSMRQDDPQPVPDHGYFENHQQALSWLKSD